MPGGRRPRDLFARQMMTAPSSENPEEMKVAAVERAKNLQTAARFLWPIPDKRLAERIHRVSSPTLIW